MVQTAAATEDKEGWEVLCDVILDMQMINLKSGDLEKN